MVDVDANKLERKKESKKYAIDAWYYAIQRIDILIITISGGGIYTVLETLKFAYENKLSHHLLIKISGAFFVLAIIGNVISQYTGKLANTHHIQLCSAEIEANSPPTEQQAKDIDDLNIAADKWTKHTSHCNKGSFATMAIGLILLMIYLSITL